jgi:hypothetical protein
MLALKQIQPSAQREGFVTAWCHIVRHWCAARYARRAAYGRRTAYSQIGAFSRCPGCGKTLLASKNIANESQTNFIGVKGPELSTRYADFLVPSWKSK